MKSRSSLLLVIASTLVAFALPLAAHHSFAAEYDNNKPVTLKGVVSKFAWVNPHAYVWVDVKDASGKVTTWAMETLSPNALARQGWNRDSLKIGDEVTIEGFAAKDPRPLEDGSTHGNARSITRPDGSRVLSGTADGGPAK
jgi:hypothetical protein